MMANVKSIALFVAVAVMAAFVWRYVGLQNDLSLAQAEKASLSAANQSHQAAIEALVINKAKAEEALAIAAQSQKAVLASIARIRKEIENAKEDKACLAADDRDRVLAFGLRNLLADHPN